MPADRDRPPRPRPLHRYGQNHLVDRGVLEAILRQAAVRPDDVVLEVGAADGLLTRPLLEQASAVHAFEVDRRYASRLERLAVGAPGLRVHLEDALKSRLGELDPPPTALVANLAYNIAIPLVMTTVAQVPSIRRWAIMVQKELGERLFAVPGTKAYAAVSVLTQFNCELERARPVARSAFRPRPNVESAFVSFARRDAAGDGTWLVGAQPLDRDGYAVVERLVRRAFAQRRKQLAHLAVGRRSRSAVRRSVCRGGRRALGATRARGARMPPRARAHRRGPRPRSRRREPDGAPRGARPRALARLRARAGLAGCVVRDSRPR